MKNIIHQRYCLGSLNWYNIPLGLDRPIYQPAGGYFHLEAIPKNGAWLKVKEEAKRQPEEYMKYFEDWLFASDKEIELQNFFGMGSSIET